MPAPEHHNVENHRNQPEDFRGYSNSACKIIACFRLLQLLLRARHCKCRSALTLQSQGLLLA
jgi:hypothetical protein